jgi:iron complex transport system substrate-binding protein
MIPWRTRGGRALAAATMLLLISRVEAGDDGRGPEGDAARTYTDAVGRTVVLKAMPTRIVSLAPNLTEIVGLLGLGPKVVGISDFCKPPAGSSSPVRVGGLMNPDLEAIVALKPDLVLATTSGNYVEDADRLARLGIPVYTCDTPDVEAILGTIGEIGKLAGAGEASSGLGTSLRSRLDAVAKRVAPLPHPAVMFVLWGDPLMVPGRGAFINDAIERAGATSISKALPARWAEFDLEQVILGRPEFLLTVPDNAAFARALAGKPEWAAVPAVKGGRVHVLTDAILQPGPRIVDAIEEIARLIHPE